MQTRNWNFDTEYILELIERGEKLLRDEHVSKYRKKKYYTSVRLLKNLLVDDCEETDEYDTNKNYNFEQLKHKILVRMRYEHEFYGRNFLNSLIKLWESEILEEAAIPLSHQRKFNMDEISYHILNVYKKYSDILYKHAKSIINSPYNQIKGSNDIYTSSCVSVSLERKSFLIIDIDDLTNTFIHELQHGIEYNLSLPIHEFYLELGPMVFEKLYCDEVDKCDNLGAWYENLERMNDIFLCLSYIAPYIKVMYEFSERNFDVDDETFINTFIKHDLLDDDVCFETLTEELKTDIYCFNIVDYIKYIVSYFKSIDIYEKIKVDSECGINELFHCLGQEYIDFSITDQDIDRYKKHIENYKDEQKRLTKS